MDNLKEAFLRSKIVSQDHVVEVELKDKLEKERIQKEKYDKEKLELDKIEKERCEEIKELNKFQDLFDNQKSRNFIIHLLYSFLSESKISVVFEDSDFQSKICCICRDDVVSTFGVIRKFDLPTLIRESLSKNETMNDLCQGVFKNHKIGIISTESKSVFCKHCYESFRNWTIARLLSGDFVISSIINKIRNAESFEKFTEHVSKQKEEKKKIQENLKMHFISK